jgi:hypothetical protein
MSRRWHQMGEMKGHSIYYADQSQLISRTGHRPIYYCIILVAKFPFFLLRVLSALLYRPMPNTWQMSWHELETHALTLVCRFWRHWLPKLDQDNVGISTDEVSYVFCPLDGQSRIYWQSLNIFLVQNVWLCLSHDQPHTCEVVDTSTTCEFD